MRSRPGSARIAAVEALERGIESPLFPIRALSGLALSIDALTLSFVRRLTDWTARLPARSGASAPNLEGVLRTAILGVSAALLATGGAVAAGAHRGSAAPTHAGVRNVLEDGSGPLTGVAASAGSPHPRAGPAPPSLSVAVLVTPPSAPSPLPPPLYVNPLAKINNLDPGRIDQGVDYGGSGPLLALGSGIIRQTAGPGWPGGAFIALQLDKGALAGRIVYYAENIAPTVKSGQHVNAGDVVGILASGFPHLEIGWAGGGVGGGTLGDALARSNGGGVEGLSSALGVDFNGLLVWLGAPGGIRQGVVGHLPPRWGVPAA